MNASHKHNFINTIQNSNKKPNNIRFDSNNNSDLEELGTHINTDIQ